MLIGGDADNLAGGGIGRPGDVAVGENVGIGNRCADPFGSARDIVAGGGGGRDARLHRDRVQFRQIEIAVARSLCRIGDVGGDQHLGGTIVRVDAGCAVEVDAVVIDRREDALVVADDQPRQAGCRIDHRDHRVLIAAQQRRRIVAGVEAVGVDQEFVERRVGCAEARVFEIIDIAEFERGAVDERRIGSRMRLR